MKKAMKKIVALALSSMTALSVFAASASAAVDPTNPNLIQYGVLSESRKYTPDYGTSAYYGDVYVSLKAENWHEGKITATVQKPNGVRVTGYKWTGKGIDTSSTGATTTVTANNGGEFTATCAVTIEYTRQRPHSSIITVEEVIKVTVSSNFVYADKENANAYGGWHSTVTGSNGSSWNDWYDDYYCGDGYWDGKYYWTDYGYWYNGQWYYYDWYYPSYSHRYEYTVDWSTDTYYYDGEKHVPTATVTVGKRTIELNVSLTSGNGIDVGRHRVVARVPSGYRGIKLDGASLYYNIEEPLKSGFVYEDGYTYYYEGGKAVTGWRTIDGDTYHFAKDGKATKGWKWLNNAWYYFGSDGKMMTEWVRDGGKIYYCYDSGVMAKSTWLKLDGYWYYFYNDGRMAESEWVLSGGKWYFLAGDGRMATNTTIPGGYYVDSTGAWVK